MRPILLPLALLAALTLHGCDAVYTYDSAEIYRVTIVEFPFEEFEDTDLFISIRDGDDHEVLNNRERAYPNADPRDMPVAWTLRPSVVIDDFREAFSIQVKDEDSPISSTLLTETRPFRLRDFVQDDRYPSYVTLESPDGRTVIELDIDWY